MENASIQRRSLTGTEQEDLKQNVRRIKQLGIERLSAPPARRASLDAEVRSLNQRCDTIIGAR